MGPSGSGSRRSLPERTPSGSSTRDVSPRSLHLILGTSHCRRPAPREDGSPLVSQKKPPLRPSGGGMRDGGPKPRPGRPLQDQVKGYLW